MRPFMVELRGVLGRHVRCIGPRYVEAGYFGTTRDLVQSSVHNACFNGSTPHEQSTTYHEHPLPRFEHRAVTTIRVGTDARIDLSAHGVDPPIYVFESPRDITHAKISVSLLDPVARSATDLGYVLRTLESAPQTPPEIRRSVARCRERLCHSEAVYTSDVVSARVRVEVELEHGTAGGLRPDAANSAVSVSGSGRAFVLQPAARVNLAARFAPGREALADACLESRVVEAEPPGWTPPCTTIVHHGVHVTLQGCRRVGAGVSVVICDLSLLSPGRDQQLEIDVDAGRDRRSTFVDDGGNSRTASMGNAGSEWQQQSFVVPLVADAPTAASLEFPDIGSKALRASRVTLRGRTTHELRFDFRGIDLQTEVRRCQAPNPR